MSKANETNPLVSIITPSYNSEAYIKDAIESVLAQTYTNWEMIIVDDCSTDNTLTIISEYEDSRLRVIELNENKGAAIARNTAINEASGRYLAFLDSDDQWYSEKLTKQLSFMQENNLAFTFTRYIRINEAGEKIGESILTPDVINYKQLLKDNIIGCLTVMLDKEKIGKIEMVNIRTRQDWVLWLSICKEGHPAVALQEVLAKYRERTNSVSSNKARMAIQNWKVYRDIEKMNLIRSIWYIIHNLFLKAKRYLR